MKKIIPFLFCMLVALAACEKDDVTPPASIDSMQFDTSMLTRYDEGESINLSQYLTITPEAVGDTVTIEWNSSDEEIATVSASGSVEFLCAGSVTITAKAMDKTAQVKLTVEKVKIKEFTIPAHLELYVGEKIKFPINDLKPKNAPLYRFEWEADNDGKIPTLSEGKWYLKADKEREYTLTASVDDAEDAKCNVKFVKPSVSNLAFNSVSATVEEGSSLSLVSSLQVTPAEGVDADTIKVIWSSSKESVATIDQNGKVQAIAAGKATITAQAGSKTATCTVEVTAKATPDDPEEPEDPEKPEDPDTPIDPSDPEIPNDPDVPVKPSDANGHEFVDLGLSVKWATMNVGAETTEDYGDYFAWGETKPKSEYSLSTYKWCNGSNENLTKYNLVDTKTVLDIEDDAANANWGGDWRMPTNSEIQELVDKCTWTWTDKAGGGYKITSKSNGNTIFLPAASYCSNTPATWGYGNRAYYWGCSLDASENLSKANAIYFANISNEEYVSNAYISRVYGCSVRPVLP